MEKLKNGKNNFWDDYLEERSSSSWFPFDLVKKDIKGKILDVGCGEGDLIKQLDKQGETYGVDLAEETIHKAQIKYPDTKFLVADVRSLPFSDNFFDFIFSSDVIEHIKNYEEMVKESARVLKSDGVLVIKTPNYPIKRFYDFYHTIRWGKSFKDDPTHVSKFNFFKLRKVLEKYFRGVHIETRNIMFENKFPFLNKIKHGNILGNIIGQKLIVICRNKK